ncbi:MAG TPA: hypothetical protein VGJ73_08150 [Verrucomicrobiae bacterium]
MQQNRNNTAELENLEMQVRKARQIVYQSELKVEAIVATIHEIEKFHPKIKIIDRQTPPEPKIGGGFNLLPRLLVKAA